MTMFAKGLLIDDIKDAAYFLGRQDTWLLTIYIFVKVEDNDTFRKEGDLFECELQQYLDEGKTEKQICELLYSNYNPSTDHDYIMRIEPEDVFNKDNMVLQASTSLKDAINLSEEIDDFIIFKSLITVLNFYNNLLNAIIMRHTRTGSNRESFIESSCFSLNYFWADREIVNQKHQSYVACESFTRSSIEDILMFHETNIRLLLTRVDSYSLYGGLTYVQKHSKFLQSFLNVVEDFMLKLLTVFHVYSTPESSKELSTLVRQFIEDANEENISLPRLDIKVELNALSNLSKTLGRDGQAEGVIFEGKKHISRTQAEQIEQHFRFLEELIERYDEAESLAFKIEFLITKYCIYQYNRFKTLNPSSRIKQIILDMQQCLQQIPYEDEEIYSILRAKVICLVWEDIWIRKQKHPSHLRSDLRWSYTVFVKHKMNRLVVWVCERLIKAQGQTRSEKKELLQVAIEAARLVEHEEKLSMYLKIERELEQEASSLDSKKLVFMNSYFIPTHPPLDCYVRFNKELRRLLYDDLRRTNKDLLVQFTEYSHENLRLLLEQTKGCRLCVIDLPIYGHQAPITSDFTMNSHSDSVIDSSLSLSTFKPDQQYVIDVLVILGDLQDKSAKTMIAKSQIPYLVTLNFHGIVQEPLDMFNVILAAEFKYIFVQKLTKMLVNGTKFETVIEQVKQYTFEDMRTKFKNYKMVSLTRNISSSEEDIDQLEGIELDLDDFFNNCVKFTINTANTKMKFDFKPGNIEEIQSAYSNQDICFRNRDSIERPRLIRKLDDSLHKYGIVNVHGRSGTGKTSFMKCYFNQCIAKEIYTDGVYMFDMHDYAKACPNGNIKDLMKQKLGDAFDEDMESYFKDKRMLVIFDGFHVITEMQQLIFPIHLVRILERNKIKVVLTSEKRLSTEDYITNVRFIRVPKLTPEESLALFLISQRDLLIKLDNASLKRSLKSDLIKECKGSPRLICQNVVSFNTKVLKIPPPDLEVSEELVFSDSSSHMSSIAANRKKNQIKAYSEVNMMEDSPENILAPIHIEGSNRFKARSDNRKSFRRRAWKRESRLDKYK